MDYVCLLKSGTAEYQEECTRVVTVLVERKLYSEARLFAEIAKTEAGEHITISQVNLTVDLSRVSQTDTQRGSFFTCTLVNTLQLRDELKELTSSSAWKSVSGRCLFWTHCVSLLTKHSTKPHIAARFLQVSRLVVVAGNVRLHKDASKTLFSRTGAHQHKWKSRREKSLVSTDARLDVQVRC